jgi:hypothetical protein
MGTFTARAARYVGTVLSLVLLIGEAAPAWAATFDIADGDVVALINAIRSANNSAEPDVINLAAGGTYTLTTVAEDDGFAGGAGLPYLTSDRRFYAR